MSSCRNRAEVQRRHQGNGPRAQWVHSYITDDKLFCEYLADDPETLREHAQRSGFPITNIFRVHGFFDPVTAEV